MKILADIVWGLLVIAAISSLVCIIVFHKSHPYFEYAIVFAGAAIVVSQSMKYRNRRDDDFDMKF